MAADDDEYVLLARLVRPQGRHGEILADILTDFPERFAERRCIWLLPSAANAAPREAVLERHWPHKGRVVLKLAGVDSIDDAETLRGWQVGVPRQERAPAEDGAFYIADLVGCAVIDEAAGDTLVGTMTDVVRGEGGAADLLVVEPNHIDHIQEELLIPFAKAYLVAVDLDARVLRMRLPAGLVEINGTISKEERAERAGGEEPGRDDAV